jgi:hypothetical protein
MGAASLMRQQGRTMPDGSIPTGSSLEPRPAVASAPVPSAPVATVRPVPTTQTRRTSAPTRAPILLQRQSFDPFDVIMGHLIDEGYAEDEKSASVIIANMSEEWKESIINEGFKRMNLRKIEKQAQRLDKHGDDRGDILRNVAARMDKESERKFSTDAARKNRKQSGEYRQRQHLRARDDAKSDIEKYGLY